MLISDQDSRSKKMLSGGAPRHSRKSSRSSPGVGGKARAPLLETFKEWLCTARQAQLAYESKRDLMALQLAHEEGLFDEGELHQRAVQLVESDLNSNARGAKGAIPTRPESDLEAENWYVIHYINGPQGRSGRMLVSRCDRTVTIYFRAKRCEDVAKYTFVFTTWALAAEFAFSLLAQARDLTNLSGSNPVPGAQGLYALSVTNAEEDRLRADAIVNRVIPRQLQGMRKAVETIQIWWHGRFSSGEKKSGLLRDYCASLSPMSSSPDEASTTNELQSSLNPKARTRSTIVHRRTKTMRNNARLLNSRGGSLIKRKHVAVTRIQAIVRGTLARQELQRLRTVRDATRTIQRMFRAILQRKRAARVIVRFSLRALACTRRRRDFAARIVRDRDALYARVTEDVVDFYNGTVHTMVSYYPLFNVIVDQVRDCALRINPTATLEPFGSSVTGLALPSSDLDLVVCFNPMLAMTGAPFVPGAPGAIAPDAAAVAAASSEELAHLFSKRLSLETDWVESVKMVGSASQPVIKLTCHPRSVPGFSIQVDLTLWHAKHTGIQNSRLIRDFVLRYHPQVGPMVLVIKQYLRECRLNSVYSGGMSSIALAIMVWVLVRDHPDHMASLGELLLTFFATYGDEGFFARNGVSARDGIYSLAHVEERQEDFHPPAVIEDPLLEGNNLAAGMFRVNEVSACFRAAHKILVDSKDAHPIRDLIRFRPVPVQHFSTQPGGSNGRTKIM